MEQPADPSVEHRRGDAVLRRRADGALELRVGGVFVMDDAQTTTERLLATATLEAIADTAEGLRILVGGLGLGYTLHALLDDPRVSYVRVAELEPAIPGWMRDGVLPGADALADPRVDLRIADVREIVASSSPDGFDAILLDVDNGPGFLVHEANAALYRTPFLRLCAEALAPDGQLCVWSMADAPALTAAMRETFTRVDVEPVPVRLQGRSESYWLLRGRV